MVSEKGKDLAPGEWTGFQGFTLSECEEMTDKMFVSFFAWTDKIYNGFCKVLLPTKEWAPNLGTYQGYGYKLYEKKEVTASCGGAWTTRSVNTCENEAVSVSINSQFKLTTWKFKVDYSAAKITDNSTEDYYLTCESMNALCFKR